MVDQALAFMGNGLGVDEGLIPFWRAKQGC